MPLLAQQPFDLVIEVSYRDLAVVQISYAYARATM